MKCYICKYTFVKVDPRAIFGYTIKKNGDATCYHIGYKIVLV